MSEFDRWPHAILVSGDARLTVLLPDAARGYYRGPRFDWSGMVALAEWKGHTFFGSWRPAPHRPRANDDAAGTAGEFGMGPLTGNPAPVGYDDAEVGEVFLKIGVGRLVKVREPVYSFGALYRILQPAVWDIRQEEGRISFAQEESPVRGYAFRYTKTISLQEDAAGFALEHKLENLGTRRVVQTHYCHNFIRIDDEPIGPDYRIELPWQPAFSRTAGDILQQNGANIEISRVPGPEEGFFALVEGYEPTSAHHSITLRRGKAALRMTGSDPMVLLQVFGTRRTLCPEPFISVSLAPGASRKWSTRYHFVDC